MTGRHGWILAVMAALGASTGARAQESAEPGHVRGLELGLRAGFQLGVGYIYKNGHSATGEPQDLKVTDAANGAIPVQFELGYRVSRNLLLGVYGQYAVIFVKENPASCPTGFDCSAYQWYFGPQAVYRFSPGAKFEPWVGLGVGMQILRSDVSGTVSIPLPTGDAVPADTSVTVTDRGPEATLVAVPPEPY